MLKVYGCHPFDNQPRFGSFPSQKNAYLTWCLDTNSKLLSFGHSAKVLALLPSQKLHHLLDVWTLTQGCFPWTLNRGSGPFTAALYILFFKILMLVSYLIEYFQQAFKFPVHFFRQPCRLLVCLILEVVINLSFQLLSSIILFVLSVRSISYKNYLNPETRKKYLNILNAREKRRRQTKNTSLLLCERMTIRQAYLR